MYMMRFSPFREWTEMKDRLDRMMEQTFGRAPEQATLSRTAWVPSVDVEETADAFILYADLPGMAQEDISLEIKEDQLILSGERKMLEEKERKRLREERLSGPFYRTFSMSMPVEREKVKASYKNGVLEVILPKKEEVKPKQVKIDIS